MNSVAIAELLQLTIAERIQLVEDLWDSIAAEAMEDPGRLPLSEAQLDEVNRRWERHLQNPQAAIPFDEAMERIERALE